MKVIITGGSGYLGQHVRRYFNAEDFSRSSGSDILSNDDLKKIENFDVVIHLAAKMDKSFENSEEIFKTNVEGTINVMNHVRKDAVFIFASTKDVYGRFADNFAEVPETCQTSYSGQSPLEWSKLIAERYVEFYAGQRNFRSCIFRLSNIYAPRTEGFTSTFVDHFADAINKGERLVLPGSGLPRRDLLHVDDLSAACEAFSTSIIRHGLYNLGGGPRNAVSLSELVQQMEKASGLQAVLDEENTLPAPVPMHYVSDLDLVSQELGWQPKVSLEEGLKSLF